jgi:hypothetical protein
MKALTAVMMTSLIALGAPAFADDSTGNSADQMKSYKACMERQKASNASMTDTAMKTVCKNEAKQGKAQQDGNDLAAGQQKDTPNK